MAHNHVLQSIKYQNLRLRINFAILHTKLAHIIRQFPGVDLKWQAQYSDANSREKVLTEYSTSTLIWVLRL